jgi:hypothetical protein
MPDSKVGLLRNFRGLKKIFYPDFTLEVPDERGTPTARQCGAGEQKISDIYSKFVAMLRIQWISPPGGF